MPQWFTPLRHFLSDLGNTVIEEFLNTERITDAIALSYYDQGDGVLREFKLIVKRRNIRKIEKKWTKYAPNRWMRLL